MNLEQIAAQVRDAPEIAFQIGHRLRGIPWRPLIQRIVSKTQPPQTSKPEKDFQKLLRLVKKIPQYSYSPDATWRRGLRRAVRLIQINHRVPQSRVLEVGCGDGMTAVLLHSYGYEVYGVDMEDWRDPRASHIPFYQSKVEEGLPFEADSFDFIYSYNTFEHLTDPRVALSELIRVCRPGGKIYLDFGPLYASAWGLHVYRTLPIPYAQFLFSEPFLKAKLQERGIIDLGRERSELQPLNRWRLRQFRELFETSSCAIRFWQILWNSRWLSVVWRYPEAFQGRGLTFDDLVSMTIRVLLEKPSAS